MGKQLKQTEPKALPILAVTNGVHVNYINQLQALISFTWHAKLSLD